MPSVGTLNLTVESNASAVGNSLEALAEALGRVKRAIPQNGLGLSEMATDISTFISKIEGIKSASTAFKNIEALGNGMLGIAKFMKFSTDSMKESTQNLNESANKVNTNPAIDAIKKLKSAIGKGFNLGMAGTQLKNIREALGGSWDADNAEKAGNALKFIGEGAKSLAGANLAENANNIKAMAGAISEYAKSIEELKTAATGRVENVTSVTDEMKAHLDDAASRQKEWFDKGGFASGEKMPLNLQFFGRKGTKKSEGQLGMDFEALEKSTDGLEHVQSSVKEVSETVKDELIGSFKQVKSEIKTATDADAFEPMKDSIDSTGESMRGVIGLIDLLQTKFGLMLRQTEKLGSKLISIGDDPLQNRKYVEQMIALMKLNQQIEKMTQLNGKATTEVSNGSEVVSAALQADKLDNMVAKYNAMVASATEAYNAGKLSDEQFASAILRIQEFGEKIKKSGGEIDQGVNEITRQINALIETLDQPVDYSNLREFIDYMTGVSGRSIVPEDELKQSSVFYTETAKNIETLFETLERPIDYSHLSEAIDIMHGIGGASIYTQEMVESAFAQMTASEWEFMSLTEKMIYVVEKANSAFSAVKEGIKRFGEGIKKEFPTISTLLKKFTQLARTRMLRYAIRQITAGISEGVKNVYNYSQAISGSFATSMDDAASALAKMKNSIGAALAPVLQSIIPILQNVINWFINLLNYVNQFFALLRGQKTWTRAIDQTRKAYEKQTKAAKNASAAVKDLLADWDELNIIQSQNSGGGSGSGTNAAEDYLNMFEEVDKYDKKIKDIVDFIRENFETIKTIAEGIAATILLWKFSRAFGKDLSMLQALQLMAGLTLTIAGIKLSANAGYDIGKNGINGKNAIEAVGGVLSTMIGAGIVGLTYGGVVGGVIGLTVGAAISLTALSLKMKEGYLDSLYGENSLDVETIRKDVEEKFLNIDAQATIDIVKANIKNTADAENKVEEAIAELKKDYPAEVNIDIANKGDFLQSVKNLVAATNMLIQFRKDNFKLYAPVSPTFGSASEFHAAMDKAWEGSESYVESIGKKIGTLLNNGINDSIELTKLKNDLLEISNAVLGGQKRGEFAAKVAIAGGALRSNNYESFDRETIKNYIQQFNQEGQSYMAQAAAFAVQEQSDRQALVDLLETRKKQGDTTFRQEELDAAKAELEAFDSYKRMMELYEDWTSPGRIVLGQDISKALSTAMGKNTGNDFNLLKNNALAYFGKSGSFDLGVDNFVQTAQRQLYAAIAEGSGMKQEDIKEFLGLSNVNPLDLFDADFANKYMSGLAEALSRTTMTREEKLSVWEALGLNSEDFTKAVEAVGTGKAASKVDLSTQGKWITEWILELGKNSTLFWDEFWGGQQSASEYLLPEVSPSEFIETAEEEIRNSGIKAKIGIEPEITNEEQQKIENILRNAMDSGMLNNRGLSTYISDLLGEFNESDVNAVLKKLGLDGNNTGTNLINQLGQKPLRVSGSMGVSDVGWTRPETTGEQEAGGIDYSQMETSVKNGATSANNEVVSELQSAVNLLQRILAKPWVVNVQATSGLGRTVNESNRKYGNVTGDTM